jgi:hypothetical protein
VVGWGNFFRGNHLEDQEDDMRIILKWIFGRYMNWIMFNAVFDVGSSCSFTRNLVKCSMGWMT